MRVQAGFDGKKEGRIARMINNNNGHGLLFDFTENLKSGHVILFYEEPEHARVIEFQFIREGLQGGQFCCYITYENRELIENEMRDSGIDVLHYTEKNLLRIIQPVGFLGHSKGALEANLEWMKHITANLSLPPFRVVGGITIREKWVTSMINSSESVDNENNAQIDMEHNFHDQLFAGLQGYWLCSYQVNDIKSALNKDNGSRSRIMAELLACHHGVVFATKSGKHVTLYLP